MSSLAAAVTIRPMMLADLDRVTAIAQSLKEAPQWPRGAYVAMLDPEARPGRIALVAETTGSGVAAFVVASLIPPQAELETITVAAESQRHGLARQLYSGLVSELKNSHVTEVQLEVRASNQPALALYRALGFQQTGCRPRYYAEPEEDALLLRLSID